MPRIAAKKKAVFQPERSAVVRSTWHGFSGLSRKTLLGILQDRCREVGVKLESASDRMPAGSPGMTVEEAVHLARMLKEHGGSRRRWEASLLAAAPSRILVGDGAFVSARAVRFDGLMHLNAPRLRALASGTLVAAWLFTQERVARADELPMDAPAATNPDVVRSENEDKRAIDRTWLYADDARVAAPWTVIGSASTSYAGVGSDPFRVGGVTVPATYAAFAGNTAQPGVVQSVGAEVGLLPRVSVIAVGQLQLGGLVGGASPGGVAGLRVELSPRSWQHLHLVASGGYLRESWDGPSFDDGAGKWSPGNVNGANGA